MMMGECECAYHVNRDDGLHGTVHGTCTSPMGIGTEIRARRYDACDDVFHVMHRSPSLPLSRAICVGCLAAGTLVLGSLHSALTLIAHCAEDLI